MKPGRNIRRKLLRYANGDPWRDDKGIMLELAYPRGKSYPYSSTRQAVRQSIQAVKMHTIKAWAAE